MSFTQQLRVWFSWNLQEKAFKQTLSISKVESEDTIAIWEKLNFRGSNRPKFHLNPNQKSFLNLFLFCRCMSDKILTELKVLVLAAPLGSSWIEPRPTTVRHLKEKHFWKSIYQYTLLSSAKNKKKKNQRVRLRITRPVLRSEVVTDAYLTAGSQVSVNSDEVLCLCLRF